MPHSFAFWTRVGLILPPLSSRTRLAEWRGAGQRVLPSSLPAERKIYEVFQQLTVDEVVERPPRRHVTDQKNTLARPLFNQLVQSQRDSLYRLSPALSTRERFVEPKPPFRIKLCSRHAVHRSVVALPQPPVEADGNARVSERDLRRFDGSVQIGSDNDVEVVVTSPLTQLPRLLDGRWTKVFPRAIPSRNPARCPRSSSESRTRLGHSSEGCLPASDSSRHDPGVDPATR